MELAPDHPRPLYPSRSSWWSDIHALRTPSDLPSLLQTLNLALAIGVRLALHEVVVVRLASRTDEVGCAHERCAAGAYLVDLGDVIWEGRGVDERRARESGTYQFL